MVLWPGAGQHRAMETSNDRALDAAAIAHLQQWVGRSETLTDEIAAAPLRGLSATLDRGDAPPEHGDAVPPLGHWLYFLPRRRKARSGRTATPSAAAFCRPCRCRAACGLVAAFAGRPPTRCAWAMQRSAPHASHR